MDSLPDQSINRLIHHPINPLSINPSIHTSTTFEVVHGLKINLMNAFRGQNVVLSMNFRMMSLSILKIEEFKKFAWVNTCPRLTFSTASSRQWTELVYIRRCIDRGVAHTRLYMNYESSSRWCRFVVFLRHAQRASIRARQASGLVLPGLWWSVVWASRVRPQRHAAYTPVYKTQHISPTTHDRILNI